MQRASPWAQARACCARVGRMARSGRPANWRPSPSSRGSAEHARFCCREASPLGAAPPAPRTDRAQGGPCPGATRRSPPVELQRVRLQARNVVQAKGQAIVHSLFVLVRTRIQFFVSIDHDEAQGDSFFHNGVRRHIRIDLRNSAS